MNLPKFLRRGGPRPGRVAWTEEFHSWDAAEAASTGYDAGMILRKVTEATRAVESGAAPYERDSVLFDRIEYSWPLLSGLLWIHSRCGSLRVLDFGGSLGSTWRQNRKFLEHLPGLSWKVVEQEGFVEVGRAEFERGPLSFLSGVAQAAESGVDLFLLASSLCYIRDHRSLVDSAVASGAPYMILDRTPFHSGAEHTILLQTVPPEIYEASYPCHVFSLPRFLEEIETSWKVVETWNCDLQPDPGATHMGMILERRPS
ncbi:MAG: methyltransferase, TIGR04325 family [Fibrobacteria bacterium]|nr:methyltransferase, TIGR04325 family [Fibrobacteria bacterium]